MHVGKWGNSLAVRLLAAAVKALALKDGDEVEIAGDRHLRIARDRSREEAIDRLRSLNWPLPPGFRFNRDEANDR